MLRRTLIASGIAFLVIAINFLIWPWYVARAERSRRQQIAHNSSQIGTSISNIKRPTLAIESPQLSFKASLEGDTTILTVSVLNPNKAPTEIRKVVLEGFKLGKVDPREKDDVPVLISELQPGIPLDFVLYYDHVPWISDDVSVTKLEKDGAQQTLDYHGSWGKSSEDSISFGAENVSVMLDPKSARALKKRRDDALKAKTPPPDAEPPTKP